MNKKLLLLTIFILFLSSLCINAAVIQIPTKARVTPSIGVNVRTGPGTNHSKITAIPVGQDVKVLSVSGSWYKIQYGSYTGYSIASAFEVLETREETIDDDDSARQFLPTLLNVDPSTR